MKNTNITTDLAEVHPIPSMITDQEIYSFKNIPGGDPLIITSLFFNLISRANQFN